MRKYVICGSTCTLRYSREGGTEVCEIKDYGGYLYRGYGTTKPAARKAAIDDMRDCLSGDRAKRKMPVV